MNCYIHSLLTYLLTNRKSYRASQTQHSVCYSDDREVSKIVLWYLLTSALDSSNATRLFHVLFCRLQCVIHTASRPNFEAAILSMGGSRPIYILIFFFFSFRNHGTSARWCSLLVTLYMACLLFVPSIQFRTLVSLTSCCPPSCICVFRPQLYMKMTLFTYCFDSS